MFASLCYLVTLCFLLFDCCFDLDWCLRFGRVCFGWMICGSFGCWFWDLIVFDSCAFFDLLICVLFTVCCGLVFTMLVV